MKIHIVFSSLKKNARDVTYQRRVMAPLGILYIAAYLRKHRPDLDLKVTDGLAAGWGPTTEEIRRFGPDVLLISFLTPTAPGAYDLVRFAKQMNPSMVVVLGGTHPSVFPQEALTLSACDAVAVGEGEQTVLELVGAVERKKGFAGIKGLAWRKESEVIVNEPRPFLPDLDEIPFPARDLIDMTQYKGWFISKNSPEASIISSRGCPCNCNFCAGAVWKTSKPWMRLRSPQNIADELEILKKDYSIREFFNVCDEFNGDIDHGIAVCDELMRRRINLTWKTSIRAAPMTEELARRMADAGCWYVQLGIESGSQPVLNGIDKNITLEQVETACRRLKDCGIAVCGNFMLFNVWEENGQLRHENAGDSLRTLEFAKRLIDKKLLSYVLVNMTVPWPGSPLYDIAKRHHLFRSGLDKNWDRWNPADEFVMDIPGLEKRDVQRLYFKANLLKGYCRYSGGSTAWLPPKSFP